MADSHNTAGYIQQATENIKEGLGDTVHHMKEKLESSYNKIKEASATVSGLISEKEEMSTNVKTEITCSKTEDYQIQESFESKSDIDDAENDNIEKENKFGQDGKKSHSITAKPVKQTRCTTREKSSPLKDMAVETIKKHVTNKETAKKSVGLASKSGVTGVATETGLAAHELKEAHSKKKSGEITDDEFKEKAAMQTAAAAGSTTGMVVGAAAGGCFAGPPGALVGGMAGQALGQAAGNHGAEVCIEAKNIIQNHTNENKHVVPELLPS